MKTAASPFGDKPRTRLGWWAVWLAAAFLAMFLINSFVFMPTSSDAPWRHVILPFYGIAMLLCGLASGIMGWIAFVRNRERSWLVLVTLLPGLWVLFMLVGEVLFPH
jgi:TctA family transporter